MSAVSFTVSGSFDRTTKFLHAMDRLDIRAIVEPYARQGVIALQNATPVDSGLASESWSYEIEVSSEQVVIYWTNTDIEDGFPVAVMIQLGHGTGTGGYVHGRDYINPAMQSIFDQMSNAVWRAVTLA